eukprot:CAMPEP_0195517576 /NCGR_PEP_ID=MMETSP0794_2-20130614/11017_1 /TAXON_ID=515487 /ORGANISM="Stephanopyxis turris, Strain CCMP 815" /LENGTH=707 /DNA_ID=CAMNT_0040646397 /DNA_START=48 /DNA_END=2171 /DNA_ORIENTATION=+
MLLSTFTTTKQNYNDGDDKKIPFKSIFVARTQRKKVFLTSLAILSVIVALNVSTRNKILGTQNIRNSGARVLNGLGSNVHDLSLYQSEQHIQTAIEFPNPLDGFKDVWEPREGENETPVFLHIPKSGGSSFKDIFGRCHRLTMAAEAGILEGHDKDTELETIYIEDNPWHKFVNVDTSKAEGLKRAKEMGLVPSGLADLIVVSHVYDAETLFDSSHKGRLFAVFRHPVDQAISLFYYLQYATWERSYNERFSSMTIQEYARSDLFHDNYLTRVLSNQFNGKVTNDHLEVAKRVVREKVLVGLLSEKEISLNRFEYYFGWKYNTSVEKPRSQEKFREEFLHTGTNVNQKHKSYKPQPGSGPYELMAERNAYDMKLYTFIETIFWEQEKLFTDISDDYRHPSQPELELQVQQYFKFPFPLDGYKDTKDRSEGLIITPVFWHIPGHSFRDIYGRCHRLTVASEAGVRMGHDKDTELETFYLGDNHWHKFVNVDTFNLAGLGRAKEMGLVPSGMAEVIMVGNIFDANILFDSSHKGQIFTVFQHPVDREISKFASLQHNTMTVQEYVQSPYAQNNWLTRFLSNDFINELTVTHQRVARRILREKVLVGLLSEKEETMDRFERFFGWNYRIYPEEQEECREQFLHKLFNNGGLGPGDQDYETIALSNMHDIDLYNYIYGLFMEQGKYLAKVSRNENRFEGATCCMCEDPPTC